jgi:hypothetical protein
MVWTHALALLILLATVDGGVTYDGYPLPGCTITLRSATASDRQVNADARRRYTLAGVKPGHYENVMAATQ